MFEIATASKSNVPILRVDGKIIGTTVNALKREINTQIEHGEGRLILDLAKVPLLDSSALGTIIATLQTLKKKNGKLVILAPQKAVMNVLKVTRLNTVLEIYDDEPSAVNAFG